MRENLVGVAEIVYERSVLSVIIRWGIGLFVYIRFSI